MRAKIGATLVPDRSQNQIMNAELVKAASEVITNQQILVNMVSRRVRQLSLGHRPLVVCAPGLREADIALTEIANGKLTFESTFGQNGTGAVPPTSCSSPMSSSPRKRWRRKKRRKTKICRDKAGKAQRRWEIVIGDLKSVYSANSGTCSSSYFSMRTPSTSMSQKRSE